MCLFQGDLMKLWLKKEGNVLKISCSFLLISLLSITANSLKSFLRFVSICRSVCFLLIWIKYSADSALLCKLWSDNELIWRALCSDWEFSIHSRNVALKKSSATPLQVGKFYSNFKWRDLEFLFIEWWAKPVMLFPGVQWRNDRNIVTVSIFYVGIYGFKPKEGRLSWLFSYGLLRIQVLDNKFGI